MSRHDGMLHCGISGIIRATDHDQRRSRRLVGSKMLPDDVIGQDVSLADLRSAVLQGTFKTARIGRTEPTAKDLNALISFLCDLTTLLMSLTTNKIISKFEGEPQISQSEFIRIL
jgi:hypothetical protein